MEQNEQNELHDEFGPTYKSLFVGCCIVLGSLLGWYATSYVEQQSRIQIRNEHAIESLSDQITKLETRVSRNEWEREAIKRDLYETQRSIGMKKR